MKKLWKSALPLFLAMFMCLGTSTSIKANNSSPQPVVTSDQTTGTLTVTKEGSSFKAYKVANATKDGQAYDYISTDSFKTFFGNTTYGNYTIDSLSKINGDGINTTKESPSEVTPSTTMAAITKNLQNFVNATTEVKDAPDYTLTSGTVTTVDLGWYLVMEATSTSHNGGDSEIGNDTRPNPAVASKAMLVSVPRVIGTDTDKSWEYDVKMFPKDDSATITKKIVEGENRFDTNTAKIEDDVKYELTSTIPTYDSKVDFATIRYNISDTMSKGLTYNSDAIIKAGTQTLAKGDVYTETVTKVGSSTKIEFVFDYAKIKTYAEAGAELTVTLSGKINTDAVIGTAAGNPNDVTLEFTNNPDESNSYDKVDDKTITYLWGVQVKKVDADQQTEDLAGAEFSLRDSKDQIVGKYTYDTNGKIVVIAGNKVTTTDDGTVSFTGLDEGEYFIHEDKAPAGYKLLKSDVKIVITGIKDAKDNYTGDATFTVTNADNAALKDTNISMDNGDVVFNVKVLNHAGVLLPSTGGSGTIIFYVGGVLLVGAAFLGLVGLKRKEHSK